MRYRPTGKHLTPGAMSPDDLPASENSPSNRNRSRIPSIKRSAMVRLVRSAQYRKISSKSRSASAEILKRITGHLTVDERPASLAACVLCSLRYPRDLSSLRGHHTP